MKFIMNIQNTFECLSLERTDHNSQVTLDGEVETTGGGARQGLSQDLETGCPKLAIIKIVGVQIFKGDHNIL